METFKIRILQIVLSVVYIILSLPLLPMMVPILPIEQFASYAQMMGVDAGVKYENQPATRLPQHVADRFGWQELSAEVATIYHELPENEQIQTGIITTNWGQASAINYYSKKYRLPTATTLHGWYYFETLRKNDFKKMYISIGYTRESLERIFSGVEKKSVFTHPFCTPYENNKPIYACRRPRFNLRQFWVVEKRIDPYFMNLINTNGLSAAIRYFNQTREKDPSTILFSERQMNTLGYEYLYNGKVKEAIQLFQMNVDMYPEAFNVYDSLAEAYLTNKQYDLAILYYKKSLKVNPENDNAHQKLAEINKLTNPSKSPL